LFVFFVTCRCKLYICWYFYSHLLINIFLIWYLLITMILTIYYEYSCNL
jgi:hypothetical protein